MSTLYDYSALPDRRPLRWPHGARIVVIFTINIEQSRLPTFSVVTH